MTTLPKFVAGEEAARLTKALGEEFAVVRNPSYVHPPYELYPLAPRIYGPVERLTAVVMDMDGTTTTTELLCLHSLETMVRRITGRPTPGDWPGLDRDADYPHIIGNSTTRHVEYLVRTYGAHVRRDAFARALLEAAVWTLSHGTDEQRRREVRATLRTLNGGAVLDAPAVRELCSPGKFEARAHAARLDEAAARYAASLRLDDFADRVRAAVDVYYHRYHEILAAVARGEGAALSRELLGGRRLIEPMPGVAVFLALTKGRLGERAGELYAALRENCAAEIELPDRETGRARLAALGQIFQAAPLRLAVVTSSLRSEAEVVMGEVFAVLREQAAASPVLAETAADLFAAPENVYDAFVTADDAGEIRLKPHRDLYAVALHALGVGPEEFGAVAGFEDSESGTTAIRAAGVGLCVAVPFSDTAGHDLSAAAHILPGGLPQALLQHNLFLKTS